MKLSIITINRNNTKGLSKTFESVACQTFVDYEYIVIDGASTDGSLSVILQYASSTIQQFSWKSESDTGVFNAMNKGIRMAKGEYLLFLNSGDFLVNANVLENVFVHHPSEDILCGRSLVSDKGVIKHTTNPPASFKLSHFYKATIAHQATFIKRGLFNQYGVYREDLKLMSDWEFWIRTIILGTATTKKINVIVSDYNLEGISSDEKNKELVDLEKSQVFIDLGLKNILQDYQTWELERQQMTVMFWVKSKPLLYTPLQVLYSIASKLNNLRKK